MVEKKFQKQKLDKDDHKTIDDTASNIRKGFGVGGVILVLGIAALKGVPKVIKIITKV